MSLPINLLDVSPIYAAVLAIFYVGISLRVGLYRDKVKVYVGDGGEAGLLARVRGHANFAENVPTLPDSFGDDGTQLCLCYLAT